MKGDDDDDDDDHAQATQARYMTSSQQCSCELGIFRKMHNLYK